MACLIEEAALLLRGSSHEVFSEVLPRGGVMESISLTSRAAVFGNLDNDGAMDIIVVNRDAQITPLRNIALDAGHWMLLHVLDEHGRRRNQSHGRRQDRLQAPQPPPAHRLQLPGCQRPPRPPGIGANESVDDVTIRWVELPSPSAHSPPIGSMCFDAAQGTEKQGPIVLP